MCPRACLDFPSRQIRHKLRKPLDKRGKTERQLWLVIAISYCSLRLQLCVHSSFQSPFCSVCLPPPWPAASSRTWLSRRRTRFWISLPTLPQPPRALMSKPARPWTLTLIASTQYVAICVYMYLYMPYKYTCSGKRKPPREKEKTPEKEKARQIVIRAFTDVFLSKFATG